MENNMIPLSLNDTFKFSCSKKVPCFNECCRDLNQFLFPYDILRMKNRLGLPSNLFLERYTSEHTGPETGLPIITFKTDPFKELKCPFVDPSGISPGAPPPPAGVSNGLPSPQAASAAKSATLIQTRMICP